MAHSFEMYIPVQNSIYIPSPILKFDRRLKVSYALPDKGVNENTGILLLIAGFGGQAESKVFQKMRSTFADNYNLVTIQCNYFGYEFMQLTDKVVPPTPEEIELLRHLSPSELSRIYAKGNFDFDAFLEIARNYNTDLILKAKTKEETISNFNDMGLMQSLDNITALLYVLNILFENNFFPNTKKIISYGYSHGAYLAHLCNIFFPSLFSLIIDNSAWLYPVYLTEPRYALYNYGKFRICIKYEYIASQLLNDKDILYLPFLYQHAQTSTNILAYHGVHDELINYKEKMAFCKQLNNCTLNLITSSDVDGKIFKNTTHGLNADFLDLFDLSMRNLDFQFSKGTYLDFIERITFTTNTHEYIINYKNVFPELTIL